MPCCQAFYMDLQKLPKRVAESIHVTVQRYNDVLAAATSPTGSPKQPLNRVVQSYGIHYSNAALQIAKNTPRTFNGGGWLDSL